MGADINGVTVRGDVAAGGMPYQRPARLPAVWRRALLAAEACCDTAAWICGLLASARHPLIRHVPVPPLAPSRISNVDPDAQPDQVRSALVRLAADSGQPDLVSGARSC